MDTDPPNAPFHRPPLLPRGPWDRQNGTASPVRATSTSFMFSPSAFKLVVPQR